jgi:hypothetical protein
VPKKKKQPRKPGYRTAKQTPTAGHVHGPGCATHGHGHEHGHEHAGPPAPSGHEHADPPVPSPPAGERSAGEA